MRADPHLPNSLAGEELISIGKMARKSGVSPSAIRGYEKLGLLSRYNIRVIRSGTFRYFYPDDAFKIAQIKAERISNRNTNLAAQAAR